MVLPTGVANDPNGLKTKVSCNVADVANSDVFLLEEFMADDEDICVLFPFKLLLRDF